MFWGHEYDGSDAWKQNELKYGKDIWDAMEKDRLDREFKESKWMMGAVEQGTKTTQTQNVL